MIKVFYATPKFP